MTDAKAPETAAPAAAPDRAKFPLGLKIALLTTLLATLPLVGVGVALIAVNREAVVNLSREVQLAVLGAGRRGEGDVHGADGLVGGAAAGACDAGGRQAPGGPGPSAHASSRRPMPVRGPLCVHCA